MKKSKVSIFASMLAVSLVGGTHVDIQAQEAGSWSARLTGVNISPQATQAATVGITYMVTDHIAVDYPITPTFKYSVQGNGSLARLGKMGEARVLPFTVFAQYRFGEAKAAFRPYLGVGATYARFYQGRVSPSANRLTGGTSAQPTTMNIENKFTLTPQLGFVYRFNERWFADVSYARTYLKTKAQLSSGHTIDMKFRPNVLLIGLGYSF